MAIEPLDWSVVVVGNWNVAILTPDGIRRRLFALPDGSPIDVEVAVDRPGRFRVKHAQVIVDPSPTSLVTIGTANEIDALQAAASVSRKALSVLSETPVSAAGVNFNFKVDEFSDDIIEMLGSELDNLIADNNFVIVGRRVVRAIKCKNGILNVTLFNDDFQSRGIQFNFHLDSQDPKLLSEWLDNVAEFHEIQSTLLTGLGFNIER
ncbi:hypothetical protein [Thauera mechernichensis]